MEFGIEKAVKKLVELESQPKIYIGVSIGGLIVWKAGLAGLKIQNLIAISATRIRFENSKPDCPIQLYYGENDQFKPNSNWFEAIDCNHEIVNGGNHEIYKDELVASYIIGSL